MTYFFAYEPFVTLVLASQGWTILIGFTSRLRMIVNDVTNIFACGILKSKGLSFKLVLLHLATSSHLEWYLPKSCRATSDIIRLAINLIPHITKHPP